MRRLSLSYIQRGKRKAQESPGSGRVPRKRTRAENDEHHQATDDTPAEKTADLEDVFQGEQKHMILEYPKGSGKWYILRCDKHKAHFKLNTLLGAARHLASDEHGRLRRDDALSVKLLGTRIRHCNPELAEKNNHAFRVAHLNGAGGTKQTDRPTHHTQLATGAQGNFKSEGNTSPAGGADQQRREAFDGITQPVVGRIYRGYWKTNRTWYAVLLLPTGGFDAVGMSSKIADTDLVEYIPRCYRSNRRTKEILGWETGFEDGGPYVTRRRFRRKYSALDARNRSISLSSWR